MASRPRKSKVTLSGRLYNERHTFQVAGEKLTKRAKQVTREIADLYLYSLNDMLELGGPGWDTSSAWYRRKKDYFLARHGLEDLGPWILTGKLTSYLGMEETQDGPKRFRVYAGFRDGKTNYNENLTVSNLVDILDAKRPLISPAWERIKDVVFSMAADKKLMSNLY